MNVRCAWCGEAIGPPDTAGDPRISHGICPPCLAAALPPEESPAAVVPDPAVANTPV